MKVSKLAALRTANYEVIHFKGIGARPVHKSYLQEHTWFRIVKNLDEDALLETPLTY